MFSWQSVLQQASHLARNEDHLLSTIQVIIIIINIIIIIIIIKYAAIKIMIIPRRRAQATLLPVTCPW